MTCETYTMPNGSVAIICGSSPRKRCACGRPATLECDWKVPSRRSGTCDRPLCSHCTYVPDKNKDLCPEHADRWQQRLAALEAGQ